MTFERILHSNEFMENKLKILSLVRLSVQVRDSLGVAIEKFETDPSEQVYTLETQLSEGMTVVVSSLPEEEVEFYPVVTPI